VCGAKYWLPPCGIDEGWRKRACAVRKSSTASDSVSFCQGRQFDAFVAAAFFDAKIAAVSKYVIGHFGEMQGSVTSADVRAARN